MSQRVEVSNIGLVNEYYQGLSPQIYYTTDKYQEVGIEGQSSINFINSRAILLDNFLNVGKDRHFEMSQAYLAEQLVRIAIKNPLEERGFEVNIAPQNLEHGKNQKGIDLIIANSEKIILLGIDLKLKKKRTKSGNDGFGWCQNTLSPFIYLKMGDWSLETKEQSGVDIRRWIQEYASPKIKTTGKLPRIFELRQYAVSKILRTISAYIESVNHPDYEYYTNYFPENRKHFCLLKKKLIILSSLFSDIYQKYHLDSQT